MPISSLDNDEDELDEEDDADAEGAAPFVVALTTHPRPGSVSAPPSEPGSDDA